MKHSARRSLGVTLLVCIIALLSACGGSGAGGSGGGETSRDFLDQNKEVVDTLFEGTYVDPPPAAPAPKAGAKLWIISYGQSYSGAALESSAAEDAARTLGWDVTIYDAKFDPNKAVDGLRQAVAAGADGVFVLWFDCASIKAGLLEADQAGVFVAADEATDCSDKPLFDYIVSYHPGTFDQNDGSFAGYLQGWGAALASYAIERTDGKAKALMFDQTDTSSIGLVNKGARARLDECEGCEVVQTVKFTGADIGPGLQQRAQQALLQHPEVDVIIAPADGVLSGGVLAALRASGSRYGSMVIAGGEGSSVLTDMRDYRGDWAVNTLPLDWSGYQAVDALNRLLIGEKPAADSGIGYQLVDKEHNLPGGDLAVGMRDGAPIDFAGLYGQSWKN
ncbi:hypothetical protein CFH99_04500 [Nocardioides aromaticivorans]|uniref:Periplasmic binding protein domain-containing protein n=1 Tax=Nocardioides aromaticivorans TaxID=200618 RepID=A0ABX7PG60_9ACTN|nr:substrate-binding domain-containing protein [Nocardioides aromaticivorans]QSR24875.1 hypothetical protein CFH99_04500 [Nocardioides aromaticivorans]